MFNKSVMFNDSKIFVGSLLMLALCCMILPPEVVHATDDFADMGQNLEEQSQGLAGAAQMIFYLLGFILAGVGLIMLAISQEKKTAVAMLIIGFILTSIGFFISMGSASLFGSDVSNTEKLLD